MAEGDQLAVLGQPLQRLALPDRLVAVDVVEHLRLEHEEAAVDPALADLRLLGELGDAVAVEDEPAEARRRPHGGHRRQLAVGAVERDELGDVDVGDAVAVGEHERLVAASQRLEPLDAPARLRLDAGVDEVDPPVSRARRRGTSTCPAADVDREVVAQVVVVEEVVLDDLGPVAERDDELVEAVARVDLHDVPEDRRAADLDHRLRRQVGLLGEARSQAAGQDHRLHAAT